jgi:ABC-type antimicrobial peptide transport system permease subunit
VSREFAAKYFPTAGVIGQVIRISSLGNQPLQIIGITQSTKFPLKLGWGQLPEIYVPFDQVPKQYSENSMRRIVFFVRSVSDEVRLLPSVASAVEKIDRGQPVFNLKMLHQMTSDATALARFRVLLFGSLGLLAFVLAVGGIFGILNYQIARRSTEIGIRMTLGARQWDIVMLVVAQGMRWVFIGMGMGICCAVAAAQLLSAMLYEVAPHDPLTLIAVLVVIGIVSSLTCFLAARRSAKVDPTAALRAE